ncbi:MAG: hypothetical protein H6562_17430 [Lewinellaceae bacterium]|nr:hypothetical protein [Lewinellaceae bacterium]
MFKGLGLIYDFGLIMIVHIPYDNRPASVYPADIVVRQVILGKTFGMEIRKKADAGIGKDRFKSRRVSDQGIIPPRADQ